MELNGKYLVVIPNICIEKPIKIGDLEFKPFGLPGLQENDGEIKGFLENLRIGLTYENQEFVHFYTYAIIQLNSKPGDIILKTREFLTVFQYVAITNESMGLERINYYILRLSGFYPDENETKYYFDGWYNGYYHVQFFAPGVKTHIIDSRQQQVIPMYPNNFLITALNQDKVNARVIRAIEFFNKTCKIYHSDDPLGDVVNLAIAFECLYKLPWSGKKHEFKKIIANKFNYELAGKWAEEFYDLRNSISHGDGALIFSTASVSSSIEQKDLKTILWKHPNGSTEFRRHVDVGQAIFKLCLENELTGRELASGHLEYLLEPNEVHYEKLSRMIDEGLIFDRDNFGQFGRVSLSDTTGNKETILKVVHFLLNQLVNIDKSYTEDVSKLLKMEDEDYRRFAIIGLTNLGNKIEESYNPEEFYQEGDSAMKKLHMARFFHRASHILGALS